MKTSNEMLDELKKSLYLTNTPSMNDLPDIFSGKIGPLNGKNACTIILKNHKVPKSNLNEYDQVINLINSNNISLLLK
jgi:hypothetical protein